MTRSFLPAAQASSASTGSHLYWDSVGSTAFQVIGNDTALTAATTPSLAAGGHGAVEAYAEGCVQLRLPLVAGVEHLLEVRRATRSCPAR